MTLQCGLKKRVTLLQYLKTVCIPSVVALLFASVCAECAGPNVDILIFPLGLKTVYILVSSFSLIVLVFIVLSMLNVLAIYTQIVMSSGKHACLHPGNMHTQGCH